MGIFTSLSSEEKQNLVKAQQIRNELYERVNQAKLKYSKQFQQIPSQKKRLIKGSSAAELAALMDDKKITALETLLVFIERTCTIGIQYNYVLDQIFDEAVQRAIEVDEIRLRNPRKRCWRNFSDDLNETYPPFFGVPVSLKEVLFYKNRITYIGHVNPINEVPKQHPLSTQLIFKIGFNPYVRTNVPQACKTYETNNNMFGYCLNPWDITRSCGGSSGGESGMVASYCSPFSISGDIGGSSRIPAAFTGLFTLKPASRYSSFGLAFAGQYSSGLPMKGEIGPLTRTVEDLILFNHFMYNVQNYKQIPLYLQDPYLKLTPFNTQLFTKKPKLKIGYFTHIKNYCKCSPSNKRAVMEAVDLLEQEGHTTRQIFIPHFQKLLFFAVRLWFSGKGLPILNELKKGEKPIPEYHGAYLINKIPWLLKVILALIIRKKYPRFAQLILEGFKPIHTKEYLHLIYTYLVKAKQQIYNYLIERQIDVIISPGFFLPALKLGEAGKFTYFSAYTIVWNLLNYPAGSVPLTTVRQDQESYKDYYKDNFFDNFCHNLKGSKGLPTNVQVISYHSREEYVLYVMSILEQKTRFREKNPCPAFNK